MRSHRYMKVLIVDDDEKLASLIQEVLDSEGYETRRARDAQHGYWTYLLFNPDLVITDIEMPEESGLEMMNRIRRCNPQVKTIYMSADLSPWGALLETEKRRYQVSPMQKPFSRIELMELVSKILG